MTRERKSRARRLLPCVASSHEPPRNDKSADMMSDPLCNKQKSGNEFLNTITRLKTYQREYADAFNRGKGGGLRRRQLQVGEDRDARALGLP